MRVPDRAVPLWFDAYEREQRLPVVRPVQVGTVASTGPEADALLQVTAGERSWLTRTVVNATGTWDHPFVPYVPGAGSFAGAQVHTRDWPGRDFFVGRRTVVVGGGASAVQFLGEIAPVTDTLWVTRREPRWRTDGFDREAGLAAVTRVAERVQAGLPPESVVSVTGLALRPQEAEAARLGAYVRHPMFVAVEPDGVRMPEGRLEPADAIVWATGFRPAVRHLAPLHLRSPQGGIPLLPAPGGPQASTTAARDHRVHLVGYGPSASTIGGNRGGLAAARAVVHWLDTHP